jgi:superfamily II helicase
MEKVCQECGNTSIVKYVDEEDTDWICDEWVCSDCLMNYLKQDNDRREKSS